MRLETLRYEQRQDKRFPEYTEKPVTYIRKSFGRNYFAQSQALISTMHCLLHISPVRTNPNFHHQRNFERMGCLHVLPHHRLHYVHFFLRHFKH